MRDWLEQLEAARPAGDELLAVLVYVAGKSVAIGEVRGKGLFWGVELVRDRESREPLVPFNASGEALAPVAQLMKAAMERGLYLMTHWNVIMICPPLTITREELDEGVAVLDEVLAIADEHAA